MKLYATVSSERASKGQGGNEYLEINIQGENKEDLGCIYIIPDGTNYRLRYTFQDGKGTSTIYIPKGERQKGEHITNWKQFDDYKNRKKV